MAALVIVALVALGIFGATWFGNFNKKNTARNDLGAQVEQVVRVDKVLQDLDGVVNSKTTTSTVDVGQAVLTQIPTAQKTLTEARQELTAIRPQLREGDQELADAIDQAISGREQMLATGQEIVSLDTSASIALTLVNEGWAKMLKAHEKSDKATDKANKGTRSGFEASYALNKEVKKELAEAKKDFEKVQSMFPDADLTPFMKYLNGRIKANKYAIATDKAALSGNIAKANTEVKKLNEQNKKSAKELKALKKKPGEALDEQYRVQAEQLLDQYDQAKKDTAVIDENVRKLM